MLRPVASVTTSNLSKLTQNSHKQWQIAKGLTERLTEQPICLIELDLPTTWRVSAFRRQGKPGGIHVVHWVRILPVRAEATDVERVCKHKQSVREDLDVERVCKRKQSVREAHKQRRALLVDLHVRLFRS